MSPSRGVDLSVVIVTWNVGALAVRCVQSVLDGAGALELDVWVVDNASTDGTPERLRRAFEADPRVRVLDAGGNLGFPRANNLALEQCRGRHVLFLNPDTEVGQGVLEGCVAELDGDAEVGAVGCRLEYADGRVQYEGARRAYRLRHLVWEAFYLHVLFPAHPIFAHQLMGEWDHRDTRDVEALMGAFIMARRSAVLAVGGLPDELFMYHEDMALCLRLRRDGWRVRYRGDLRTLHLAGASSGQASAPLDLLEGEVRVRLIGERGGWLAGVAARVVYGVRQLVRLGLSVPAALLPPVRRRYPRVAEVGTHARLLAWTVWPGAVHRRLAALGVPRDRRPGLLVVGPTPPPVHGTAAYVHMLVTHLPLRARFRVHRVDTSDRRPLDRIGRVDVVNVWLGLRHAAQVAWTVLWARPALCYVPVSQNGPAFLRDALFVALAHAGGCRVVTHLHGGYFDTFYRESGAPLRWVIRWVHRRVARAWVLSEGLAGLYDGLMPPERVRVVPNGVPDLVEGRDVPARQGPEPGPDTPCRIVFLGQLGRAKGVDTLLDAVAALHDRGVPVQATLAGAWGPNDDPRTLGDPLASLMAVGVVTTPGVVGGDAKVALLTQGDVFVLVTRYPYEGQPLAILEAMAAGLPVVATPRAAIPDMVLDGVTGFLVPEGDAQALADAVERLAADPTLRRALGAAGRARYEASFTAARALGRATEELTHALG